MIALAATAVPALLVPIPTLLDRGNHVARMWLLSGGAELPPVSGMYAVDWTGASTKIGIDLLAAALGPRLPLEWLSSLVLAASLVLPPLGAVMLNRGLSGDWHWRQAGFAFLAWNETMLAGFVNFQIALGLALLAAAADPALARRGAVPAFAARALATAALLAAHIFGTAFYAALLGAVALGGRWGALAGRRVLALAAGRATPAGHAVATAFLLFLLFAPSLPGDHVSDRAPTPRRWSARWPWSPPARPCCRWRTSRAGRCAMPRRRAFMPLVFTARGKQPLRVLPSSKEISQETAPAPRCTPC